MFFNIYKTPIVFKETMDVLCAQVCGLGKPERNILTLDGDYVSLVHCPELSLLELWQGLLDRRTRSEHEWPPTSKIPVTPTIRS